jgi:hypothetical protein
MTRSAPLSSALAGAGSAQETAGGQEDDRCVGICAGVDQLLAVGGGAGR